MAGSARLDLTNARPLPPRVYLGAIPHTAIGRLGAVWERWHERAAGRRQLAGMNERQLLDIGLSRAEAEWALSKPFWRG